MKYLVKLKPLEPFLFGGDQTYGTLGDKEAGSYLVKSRMFPQQTALLGMIKKELMIQANLLTRKRRGEWIDRDKSSDVIALVGGEKFNMLSETEQDLGTIKKISPVFLMKDGIQYIKRVDIDSYTFKNGVLEGYNPKNDIYDNFISIDGGEKLKAKDIFQATEQVGNKKGGEDNSLFKKTSYLLKDGFVFAFYIELGTELKSTMVSLGADRSAFMMSVAEDSSSLDYNEPEGHLTLLSDAYIKIDIKNNCHFAITSEISHRNLISKKSVLRDNKFEKSEILYLYERGSVFIEPSDALLEDLAQKNLQNIGYNTKGKKS